MIEITEEYLRSKGFKEVDVYPAKLDEKYIGVEIPTTSSHLTAPMYLIWQLNQPSFLNYAFHVWDGDNGGEPIYLGIFKKIKHFEMLYDALLLPYGER